MGFERNEKARIRRRVARVRQKQKRSTLPKVTVFRSLKHMYAQIIDMHKGKTIVSCSTLELENISGSKKEVARSIGLELAKKAKNAGIESVIFDRGPYLYHGRVKELSEGLREGGLQF